MHPACHLPARVDPPQCETRTIEEVREAVAYLESHPTTKLTRIMLDNMVLKDASQPGGVDVSLLRQALAIIGDRAQTEASGNITMGEEHLTEVDVSWLRARDPATRPALGAATGARL